MLICQVIQMNFYQIVVNKVILR